MCSDDSNQARVQETGRDRWLARASRSIVAAWNEENRGEGGCMDEGRCSEWYAAKIVWSRGGEWPEFQKRYRAELTKRTELLAKLRKMEQRHGTLTLLFGAKDEAHNQAVVLAEVLRERQ